MLNISRSNVFGKFVLIVFSARDKSRVEWDNSQKPTQKQRTLVAEDDIMDDVVFGK